MQGRVVEVQRFSTQDGPGIRTTVFMKGCNLQCRWCHNPETIDPRPAIGFLEERCIACGGCGSVCPAGAVSGPRENFDLGRCIVCGACVDMCPENALNIIGEERTAEDIFDIVMRDKKYYERSGGGLTVSGGEAMLQHGIVRELFQQCAQAGIHTALDTAGNVPYQWFAGIMPYTDLFLYDVKVMDDDLHQKYTGVSNRRILANLERLIADGANLEIRIPVVCGVNDNEENMRKTAALINGKRNVKKLRLLPYHSMGVGKRGISQCRTADVFETPAPARLEELSAFFDMEVER